MRSSIAGALAAALALLSPGLPAYAAAGRALRGDAGAPAVAPASPAAPLPSLAPAEGLQPGLALPANGQGEVSAEAPQAAGPATSAQSAVELAAAASASPAAAAVAAPGASAKTVEAARKGFLGRWGLVPSIWRDKRAESEGETGKPGSSQGLRLQKADGQRMPEIDNESQPRRRIEREDPASLDELGNPRRDDSDEGPDSRDGGLSFGARAAKSSKIGAALLGVSPLLGLLPGHLGTAGHLLWTGLGALGFAGLGALGFTTLASGAGVLGIVAAVAPLLSALAPPPPPAQPALDGPKRVEYVVILKPGERRLIGDQHLSFVDVSSRLGVARYQKALSAMTAELDAAGVASAGLSRFGATPVATYQRINAATLSVDTARAAQLKSWLESQDHEVWDNREFRIPRPVPVSPEQMGEDWQWGSVSMQENVKLMRADAALKLAELRFGKPGRSGWRRLVDQLIGVEAPPAVPSGVIDTGRDPKHPLLKDVVEKNMTAGPAGDDNGHGSWTQSTSDLLAPWATPHATHYKAFAGETATLDDLLKSMTEAANDGKLVISNSWGDDTGDPNSPDSKLVLKLAQEGHIMVFAAGNAGPMADTIGSPAIVQYQDPKSKAIRVLAVAAADRNKKIAFFSSRGDHSPMTRDSSLPTRPDLSAEGVRVEGAWPAALGPDRVDPDLGPVKAISGTSMSTPAAASAIKLLCLLFGVTQRGEKLDAIVNAVMETLEPTGQGHPAEGGGFINVDAAYHKLEKTLGVPVSRALGARFFGALTGAGRWESLPPSALLEYSELLAQDDVFRAHEQDLRSGLTVYDDDVHPAVDRAESECRAKLDGLEAAHPALASLQGMRGRLWLAARGL